MAEHIVIAGKGGVGKSTTAANLAVALAESGKRVLLVSYHSGSDSTAMLRGRRQLLPLPGWDGANAPLCAAGYHHTLCLEAGALALQEPEPAGSLLLHPVVLDFAPHFVIHDAATSPPRAFALPATIDGDVRLFAVTCANMASIEVVNATFSWLNTVAAADCRFGGIIVNNVCCALYDSIISDFACRTGTSVAGRVSHSLMLAVADFHRQTVMEAAPLSNISFAYRKLARVVLEGERVRRPAFLPPGELKEWAVKWGDILAELETGVVRDGGSI